MGAPHCRRGGAAHHITTSDKGAGFENGDRGVHEIPLRELYHGVG